MSKDRLLQFALHLIAWKICDGFDFGCDPQRFMFTIKKAITSLLDCVTLGGKSGSKLAVLQRGIVASGVEYCLLRP